MSLQLLIAQVEKRAKQATIHLMAPPPIQSFGERRLSEQKKKNLELLKRRENDMKIRQSLGATKRLKLLITEVGQSPSLTGNFCCQS